MAVPFLAGQRAGETGVLQRGFGLLSPRLLWLFAVTGKSQARCLCSHLGFACKSSRGSSSCTHKPPYKHILGCKPLTQHSNPSSRGEIALSHAKGGQHVPTIRTPQALHFRSGLTLPPRLEVPVHWRGLHVGGKLRQRAGEFFSADHGEGEGGRGRAHGDVSIRGAVRGRGAGPHGHIAVLSAIRRCAQRGESARLHGHREHKQLH